MSLADPNQPNEAARLTQQLLHEGCTKRQVARILGRDASLVSQFFTKGKGKAYVNALRQVVRAVRGGERVAEALSAVAQENVQRRRTKTGQRAWVRGKDVVGEAGGSMAGRAGKQAIKSGASHLAPVVHETGQVGGRLAFTVRMKANQYTYSAGSEKDSPGLRRGFIPRADGTEERTYGSASTGGFDAAEWSQRVADHHGDVTEAMKAWLVETGRAVEDADIAYLEVRGWLPEEWPLPIHGPAPGTGCRTAPSTAPIAPPRRLSIRRRTTAVETTTAIAGQDVPAGLRAQAETPLPAQLQTAPPPPQSPWGAAVAASEVGAVARWRRRVPCA